MSQRVHYANLAASWVVGVQTDHQSLKIKIKKRSVS